MYFHDKPMCIAFVASASGVQDASDDKVAEQGYCCNSFLMTVMDGVGHRLDE